MCDWESGGVTRGGGGGGRWVWIRDERGEACKDSAVRVCAD